MRLVLEWLVRLGENVSHPTTLVVVAVEFEGLCLWCMYIIAEEDDIETVLPVPGDKGA